MIVLDTNVLSAVMERRRAPAVLAWFERQAAGEVWLTAVTLYEARYGIDRLKPGARRDALQSGLERAAMRSKAGWNAPCISYWRGACSHSTNRPPARPRL